ncbi:MAG: CPBP family intramembrane metalloprotease [Ruminococcaceae bacterium]|nr:CPBP family intramembrane metalloprotease [Oscillospiraceae bacterium]
MKKLYEKSELAFSIVCIVIYCVAMSVGDMLSEMIGVQKLVTLIIGSCLSGVLLLFLLKNKLGAKYGICRPNASARAMLWYMPLVLLLPLNLIHGLTLNSTIVEAVLYILAMLCVGFLEEIIFRGLLFESMRRDNPRAAVIVSSITFGIGHIINLVNGSGAEVIPNLLQIIYATAAGFMFVMIYCKSGSILCCIAFHGLFNALSVFAEESVGMTENIIVCLCLTVISGAYALYLALSMKRDSIGKSGEDTGSYTSE